MDLSIGLFDSGFGGLTVMREVAQILPQENLIYLGDTARLPYGNKSPETILQFAKENSAFLLKQKIKLLIVACHTACAHSLKALQEELPIPVIGVIAPSLALIQPFKKVAVLATTSTIESGIYQQRSSLTKIYAKACPLFVPLIEEGLAQHPSMQLIAQSYLEPLIGKVDAVLLACTHYPLIRATLEGLFGPEIPILEPAKLTAELARAYLSNKGLLNEQTTKPTYTFYVTDNPEKFRKLGEPFFGAYLERVEKIDLL